MSHGTVVASISSNIVNNFTRNHLFEDQSKPRCLMKMVCVCVCVCYLLAGCFVQIENESSDELRVTDLVST